MRPGQVRDFAVGLVAGAALVAGAVFANAHPVDAVTAPAQMCRVIAR